MATKAELEQQVTELQSQLAAAQSAPDAAPRLPGLAERIWLPKSLDEEVEGANGSFKTVKQGKTLNGKEWLSFKAQVSHEDKDTKVRTYSKHRFTFKAWNENAQLIKDLIEANDRLVDVTANYWLTPIPTGMVSTSRLTITSFFLSILSNAPNPDLFAPCPHWVGAFLLHRFNGATAFYQPYNAPSKNSWPKQTSTTRAH